MRLGDVKHLPSYASDWLNESASRSGNIRSDLNELVTSGTVILGYTGFASSISADDTDILRKKMLIAGEETLIPRLLDLWSFFFATVVPYVQGVFVPIQERVKGMEGPSASIDIRAMTLIAFRDKILIPLAVRMEGLVVWI
ncbi:hypothetical protein BDR26DRAFT_866134 [Obelidium mucronatum]|nr:hypothetical protein BDR26DRAFT_866134 [Obelidium mucronatum]